MHSAKRVKAPTTPAGSGASDPASAASARAVFVRTCIGCRRSCHARELVRLVLADGRPAADPERRRPGRGASIHPSASCVELALRRGALERAFRRSITPVTADELLRQVMAAFGAAGPEPGNRNHS